MTPRPRPLVIATSIAFASLLASGRALANPSLNIQKGDKAILSGDHAYKELVLEAGATLVVKPYAALSDGGVGDGGTLHVRAHRIVINAGATLDATGAGYPGENASNGAGPGGGVAGAGTLPGGGGAFFGNGGPGRDAACTLIAANGGMKYGDPNNVAFGSAGGAAGSTLLPSLGGAGGGHITLEASEIVIDGNILARGAPGTVTIDGVGSGGGAGGAIDIRAALLSGSGTLSVRGGLGGPGFAGGGSNGGGGGGGWIHIIAQSLPPGLKLEYEGGLTGACPNHGEDGPPPSFFLTPGCIDLDGDTVKSAACGGTDCDDSDPFISPGHVEDCDGRDNDCNGKVDDVKPSACAGGKVCIDGECRPPPPGPPPEDPGARPDHVEFDGACALQASGGSAAAAVLTCALAAFVARRRRRAPSREPR